MCLEHVFRKRQVCKVGLHREIIPSPELRLRDECYNTCMSNTSCTSDIAPLVISMYGGLYSVVTMHVSAYSRHDL